MNIFEPSFREYLWTIAFGTQLSRLYPTVVKTFLQTQHLLQRCPGTLPHRSSRSPWNSTKLDSTTPTSSVCCFGHLRSAARLQLEKTRLYPTPQRCSRSPRRAPWNPSKLDSTIRPTDLRDHLAGTLEPEQTRLYPTPHRALEFAALRGHLGTGAKSTLLHRSSRLPWNWTKFDSAPPIFALTLELDHAAAASGNANSPPQPICQQPAAAACRIGRLRAAIAIAIRRCRGGASFVSALPAFNATCRSRMSHCSLNTDIR